ncbi:S-layer homology domain-containing protein [Synechocystis salina]|uniref:S-layer homology domain-containing protein n=1 Tax=Synechocystis salina LEGE 00031 TaxID=1828736 RepID=A0ABR9VVL2_9SYNC|nr:S-layer homology domain-containing protein [Synechocystis salina]MBE9241951.1 S-layer homology domain-containing protein [Synechocystis salina LEGE 00041]MBE9255388.1 S-layer homology domain-containing protein [Synechocystis salina LEGE 00031]
MIFLNRTLLSSGLIALAFIPIIPRVLAQSSSFGDLQGYWGGQYVTTLAERGIIGGFPDGSFQPNAQITRAQFAAIAVKAFNLSPGNSTRNFRDVPSNYWAAPAILAVSSSGLVTGFPDGSFRPEERITRAQALVILAKALGNNTNANPSGLNVYGDRQAVPEWALDSVARAANAGIIVNFPNTNQINPNNLATRGEVAGLVYQTLVKLGDGSFAPINIGLNNPSAPTPSPTPTPLSSLVIERIETNSNPRQPLREGDDLLIRVYGSPGANASFELEGLNQNRSVTMNEVQSGIYETSYRIGRNDRQINARPLVFLSRSGQNSVSRQFNQAIAINIDNPSYPYDPGNVGYVLRPEITNFNDNDVIRLPDNLMGQTLPDANVEVNLETFRNVIGVLNFSQTIFQSTVRADQTGRFIVYLPQFNRDSGTVYRVRMTATQGNQSQSSELLLRQE